MLLSVALTLFVSAFLLFCCEPMIGKIVLPVLGGAGSVWTTCVLFFQAALLIGYVYAHLLGKIRRLSSQILIHALFLVIALTFLPPALAGTSGPASASPVRWLLIHLSISVGLPFAVLSATAPLVQSWLARTPG